MPCLCNELVTQERNEVTREQAGDGKGWLLGGIHGGDDALPPFLVCELEPGRGAISNHGCPLSSPLDCAD